MTSDRHRALAVFKTVCDLEGTELTEALKRECGADASLRERVDALLARDRAPSGLLDEANLEDAAQGLASLADATWLPERIGAYRVERRIGEGGMGVVYEALQESPRRKVAIKLLHPQLATPERLRRFRHEAELLGRLQHPGIAQIHEAGTYDLGRGDQPYFAMELVEGVSIRLHADRERLDVRGRLELLARVADAVHHAHERGVVHRDLKPDNILVDGRGQPKVLDFGVARASEGSDVVSTLLTQEGTLLGTLAYMAPEQLTGESAAITPRSDVYALGVIAFELTSGRLPHEIGGLQLPAAMKVLEEEPTRALSADDPSLRGDVETIVAKALERDPERRYASAEAFAADVRRFLDDLPIAARPPSRVYLLGKYVRRNRSLVAVAAALLVAALVSAYFGAVAADQRDLIAEERNAARRQSYSFAMQSAAAALADGDLAELRSVLDRAPEELRQWEWRFFDARLDQARSETLLELGEPAHALLLPGDGSVVLGLPGEVRRVDLATGAVRWRLDCEDGTGAILPAGDGAALVVSYTASPRTDFTSKVHLATGTWAWRRHCPWTSGEPHIAAPLQWSVHRVEERIVVGDLVSDRVAAAAPVPRSEGFERLALAPGGDWVAVKTPERIALFRVRGEEIVFFREVELSSGGGGIVFSPEGRWLVNAGFGEVWIISIADPGQDPRRLTLPSAGPLNEIAFSPESTRLFLAGGKSGAVHVFDTSTWRRTAMLGEATWGDESRIANLTFSKEGRLVTLDFGGELREWFLGDGDASTLGVHASFAYALKVARDGGLVYSGGWDGYSGDPGALRVWDARTGAPVFASLDTTERIFDLDEAPAGGLLATAGNYDGTGRVRVRRSHDYRELWSREVGSHGGNLRVALDPKGERLAVFHEYRMTVFGARTGEVLFDDRAGLLAHLGTDRVGWSPSGDRLVWCTHDELVLLDGFSFTRLAEREVGAGVVRFLPDGARLVAATVDGELQLLDASTLELEAGWMAHPEGGALCVAISPDGTRIASGGRDRTVRLWDTATQAPLGALSGHESYVHDLAWSPDGESLYSASGDGTVRVWTTETPLERTEARRERERILARVEPAVLGWIAELGDTTEVQARIDATAEWTPREREVAGQVLLGEAYRATAAAEQR